MRIVQISDYENTSGAARATTRLARALSSQGHEVMRVVAHRDYRAGQETRLLGPGVVGRALLGVLRQASSALAVQLERQGTRLHLEQMLTTIRPDVINMHNVHGASLGLEIVEHAARHAPVVWTLHDMWSFTGRCTYAYDCRRFETGCDARCPTPHEYPALAPEAIADAFARRKALSRHHPGLVLVTPSRWLAEEASRGLWAEQRVEVIPHGVPFEIYAPQPAARRARLRRDLGLAEGELFGLMIAQNITDRRKGMHFVVEALAQPLPGLVLGTIGHSDTPLLLPGTRTLALGSIDEEQRMAEACAAADFLLHPAQVDNLPNVVLEAMACGTPTVAFPIGGLPDMVRPGETGWLAADVSAVALRGALEEALAGLRSDRSLRIRCREVALQDYAPDTQATRYVRLFRELAPQAGI